MELTAMTEKIEIEIKSHVHKQIQHALDERNKELKPDRQLNEGQYISLLLERHFTEKEYDELYNKLSFIKGKLQGLENSIEGKKAQTLFTIDELIERSQ